MSKNQYAVRPLVVARLSLCAGFTSLAIQHIAHAAATIFVDAEATLGRNNGSSWANASPAFEKDIKNVF